jgi:hypothetical protein
MCVNNIVTCLTEGRRYMQHSCVVSCRVVSCRLVHVCAHHSGILVFHGNQQLEGQCFHCCWQC